MIELKKNSLKVVKIDSEQDQVFKNLQQFYEFEFSALTNEKTNSEGVFDCKKIKDTYWSEKGAEIYLLFNEETPIGFCVVNLSSMVCKSKDGFDIADFFIMPAYRLNGVGEWLAHRVFALYKGRWEVRQFESLPKITEFWRKVVSHFTGGEYEEFEHFNLSWGEQLTVQSFLSS